MAIWKPGSDQILLLLSHEQNYYLLHFKIHLWNHFCHFYSVCKYLQSGSALGVRSTYDTCHHLMGSERIQESSCPIKYGWMIDGWTFGTGILITPPRPFILHSQIMRAFLHLKPAETSEACWSTGRQVVMGDWFQWVGGTDHTTSVPQVKRVTRPPRCLEEVDFQKTNSIRAVDFCVGE